MVGSIRLFRVARSAQVRKLILISSVSAFEGCSSLYGNAKLAIERAADELGGLIVRPGLIYGDPQRGMFGSLCKVAELPMIPVVNGGHQPMVLVHIHDLTRLIESMIENDIKDVCKVVVAAHPLYISFRDVLKQIARRKGKTPIFISVPGKLAWVTLYTMESLGLRPRFRSDSLVSLLNLNRQLDFFSANPWGGEFRSFLDQDDPVVRQSTPTFEPPASL